MDTIFDKFFEDLDEPRKHEGKIEYNLRDVLVMAIMAVIGGCPNWEEIEIWCSYRKDLFLDLLKTDKVPSHDTFRRVFMLLDVEKFEFCFAKMMGYVSDQKPEIIRDIIAIDGKSLRGSRKNATYESIEKSALHVVNAWSVKHGMVLGQRKVDSKSNEIKAIPELLDVLDIDGKVITIDAMGTQKSIAEKIIEKKGDYVLALKGNHGKAFEQIDAYFQKEIVEKGTVPECDGFDGEKHGRNERRRYFIRDAESFERLKSWQGIKKIVAVESIRSQKHKAGTSVTFRYYITSCTDDDKFVSSCIRSHWHVENRLHWSLDVIFREDQNTSKNDNSAVNLSILRKIAINALRNEKSFKKSVPLKRRRAEIDHDYLKKIIAFE